MKLSNSKSFFKAYLESVFSNFIYIIFLKMSRIKFSGTTNKKRLIVSELQPKKWISVDTIEDLDKIKIFFDEDQSKL